MNFLAGGDANCSKHNVPIANMSCFGLNSNTFKSVLFAKTVLAALACLTCCLTITIIILFKAYKKFVHRLSLYSIMTAFFNSMAFILNSLPVANICGYVVIKHETLCVATGFLDQFTTWMILLLVCWIILQLFLLGVLKWNNKSRKYEIGGLLATLAVSLTLSIIPFINFGNGTAYGLAVSWCWIKTVDANCSELTDGIAEQFTWYGAVMVVVILNFLAITAVITVLCKGKWHTQHTLHHKYQEALKEAMPLLLYPIIFCIIYNLAFINRVYYAIAETSIDTLLIIHAVAEASLPLCIPLAYLLRPSTLKNFRWYKLKNIYFEWRNRSEYSHTHFIVSREDTRDTERKRLIIEGKTVSYSDQFMRESINT